jgi:hypothetical protein
MPFCQNCGYQSGEKSIFCANCGTELIKKDEVIQKPEKIIDKDDVNKSQHPPQQYTNYKSPNTTTGGYAYVPSLKAPMGDRCIAFLIDDLVSSFLVFCYVGSCIYISLKDTIRDGRSLGKGLMNLRVIDFYTGNPATFGQSFTRNCIGGCFDCCTCYIVAFTNNDGRRIGDQMAGTIVIRDR